jgi:hypothetical protein
MYSKIAVDRIMGMADIEKNGHGIEGAQGLKKLFWRESSQFLYGRGTYRSVEMHPL